MHRAGFALHGNIQHRFGRQRQRRTGFTGHGQQGDRFFLQARDDEVQLFGRAGVGDKQHHVTAFNHPQIAVQGFSRVHEERRCPGARQRCGNFFADVAGLADPGDNHFAFTLDDGVGGADKIVAQPFRQAAGLL